MCADLCNELPEDVKQLTTLMANDNETEDNVSTVLEDYERMGYPPAQLERMIYRYVFFHHPACSAYRFLWTFIPPIIILLGSFGNILSFLVLRHPSTRYVSAFVYLTVRSVVDEVVLIVGLLRRWIDYLINRKLEDTSSTLCKMAQFAGVSSSFLSVWLTVTLTAERALVVSFPLHGTRFITYSRVRRLIFTLTVICVLLSTHFFITVDLIPIPGSTKAKKEHAYSELWEQDANRTVLQRNYSQPELSTIMPTSEQVYRCNFKPEFAALAWLWTTLDAVIYCYLPFIFIFGLNVVIVHHANAAQKEQHRIRVRHSTISMQQLGKTPSFSREQVNNVRQMTIMLLVISFAFLITTLAIVVTKILSQVLDLSGSSRRLQRLNFQLADSVAELLMYINHAMNFYLFCATGKRFRSRLWLVLAKCRISVSTRETVDFLHTACLEPEIRYPVGSNLQSQVDGPQTYSLNPIRKHVLNSNRREWIDNVVCNPPCTRCQSAPPYGRSPNYSSGSVASNTASQVYASRSSSQIQPTFRNAVCNRHVGSKSRRRCFCMQFSRGQNLRAAGHSPTDNQQWTMTSKRTK
ncbi:G-protein coupled receptor [Fasciola gigantica]|uniref:G-protein coupled receptor n=1 Tax=Fasciola gigantica TaxID=46835 RepID=A0A504YW10_FASGI|nr:G-protein coupled receptor [Fasciola gigantica]